jgi:hypothetical protein
VRLSLEEIDHVVLYCRLILPDQSTVILSPPAGQSLGEMVEGVLARRGEQAKQFLIYLHTGDLLDPLLRYTATQFSRRRKPFIR